MDNPIHAFQKAILNPDSSVGARDDLLARLVDATSNITNLDVAVGAADLAGLVRQCLVRTSLELGGSAQLRVPAGQGWPTLSQWQLFRCCAVIAGSSELVVHAEDWRPDWLDEKAPRVIEAAVSRSQRRSRYPVPIDPVVTPFGGFTTYSSGGQRAAVRAAFLMSPGTSLIVNLPTGTGSRSFFNSQHWFIAIRAH